MPLPCPPVPTHVAELALGVNPQFRYGTVQRPDMPGIGPLAGTTYPDQLELIDPGNGDTGVADADALGLEPAEFTAIT